MTLFLLVPLAVTSALAVSRQLDRWERNRARGRRADPYFDRTSWF